LITFSVCGRNGPFSSGWLGLSTLGFYPSTLQQPQYALDEDILLLFHGMYMNGPSSVKNYCDYLEKMLAWKSNPAPVKTFPFCSESWVLTLVGPSKYPQKFPCHLFRLAWCTKHSQCQSFKASQPVQWGLNEHRTGWWNRQPVFQCPTVCTYNQTVGREGDNATFICFVRELGFIKILEGNLSSMFWTVSTRWNWSYFIRQMYATKATQRQNEGGSNRRKTEQINVCGWRTRGGWGRCTCLPLAICLWL